MQEEEAGSEYLSQVRLMEERWAQQAEEQLYLAAMRHQSCQEGAQAAVLRLCPTSEVKSAPPVNIQNYGSGSVLTRIRNSVLGSVI